MVIVIRKVGEKYVGVLVRKGAREAWDVPSSRDELYDALADKGCHPVDIEDAFHEADHPEDSRSARARTNAVRALVELWVPLAEISARLDAFSWDAPEALVHLEARHLRKVLERYLDGAMDAQGVEAWANAIEGRDDVGIDPGSQVAEALFELANPKLRGALTPERARELLAALGDDSA